jgi:DNA-binding NtrC family response regulator
VPPLRERIEDIPELVQSYIGYFQSRIGSYVEGIRPEALEALARYSWPGNVRELINVIERAMLLCADTMIGLRDLPPAISGEVTRESSSGILGPDLAEGEVPESWLDKPWGEVRRTVLETCERGYLAAILRQTDGRVGATAKRAGMQPRSLYEKMKRYGLSKEQFRRGAKRGAESQGS